MSGILTFVWYDKSCPLPDQERNLLDVQVQVALAVQLILFFFLAFLVFHPSTWFVTWHCHILTLIIVLGSNYYGSPLPWELCIVGVVCSPRSRNVGQQNYRKIFLTSQVLFWPSRNVPSTYILPFTNSARSKCFNLLIRNTSRIILPGVYFDKAFVYLLNSMLSVSGIF